jgi:hypothetical protein
MFVTIVVLFFACKKEDTTITTPKTKTDLLTQKQWLISTAGFDENKNGNIEADENVLVECQKGNGYLFNNSGTGLIVDNPSVCDPTQNTGFDWKLISNELVLQINFVDYIILQLDEKELYLKGIVPTQESNFLMRFNH